MQATELIRLTEFGLYCPPGDFYIDPWASVEQAVITHAHSDHARAGNDLYLTSRAGEALLRERLGAEATIDSIHYGESITLGEVSLSMHPAGHVLGSSQVRINHQGFTAVVTGDYKLAACGTCDEFEPLACDLLITESTFGLPVFRWPDPAEVFDEIHAWWRQNRDRGIASLLYVYSLGKAQRILAGLDSSIGDIYTHGAVERMNRLYEASGIALSKSTPVKEAEGNTDWGGSLILAPPMVHRSKWVNRFGSISTAMASGWMSIRGIRRRRGYDRGFVMSDHADWNGLLKAIKGSGASEVWVTHGYAETLARYLDEHGVRAKSLQTQFGGEGDAAEDAS